MTQVPLTQPQLEGESLARLRGLAWQNGIDPTGMDRRAIITELLKVAALRRAVS